MIHVAVIAEPYVEHILQGRKRVELRLSVARQPWHGHVFAGERIYFKVRGGDIVGTAIVQRVHTYPIESAEDLEALRKELTEPALAPPEFWEYKSDARHAVAIWLSAPERVAYGPRLDARSGYNPRTAWCTLPDVADVYPQCLSPQNESDVAFVDPLKEDTELRNDADITSESRSSRTALPPPSGHTPPKRRSA